MIKLKLEKKGRAKGTQETVGKLLALLAKKADLDNPDEVNLAIARYKKQNGQPATNTFKASIVDAYSKYVEYNKIADWERPTYTAQPKGIQPPTEDRIKLLIASAKMRARAKWCVRSRKQ
jgi:hypothetical protein